MSVNRRRGFHVERRIAKALRACKIFAIRVPVSGGRWLPDILCFHQRHKYAVQVKSTLRRKYSIRKNDITHLLNFVEDAERFGIAFVPVFVVHFRRWRRCEVVLFDDEKYEEANTVLVSALSRERFWGGRFVVKKLSTKGQFL